MAANDVNEIQIESQSTMQEQYDIVSNFLATLAAFTGVDSVTIPRVDTTRNFLNPAFAMDSFSRLESLKPAGDPRLDGVIFPSFSGQLQLSEVSTPSFGNLDDLSATPYSPVMPTAPSVSLPSAPGAPGLQIPAVPTIPVFSLPTAPTFQAVQMPSPLSVSLPDFQFSVPVSDLTAPTEHFSFSEQDYQSVLSDALKVKLLNDIENGGYGIETTDERALWDRARERTTIEANARVEEALRVAASRGFSLPPGADMAVIAEAQQAALEKVASVDREIALKRSDMYVENRKFAITAATQVENMFIQYRSAMMERTLNAAKALVELSVAVFNAKKDKYMADLEAYKAYATVFEAKIRAELAKVEIFKAQIESAKGQIAIQQGMVDVYHAQIDGVKALIDVYRTQMEGTKVLMDIERTKIEAFRTQMEGYAVQVQAKTAEFGLYEAQIKGEVAKLSSYEAQVRGFQARVEAYKARIAAEDAKVGAQKTANDARIAKFEAELGRYKADLEAALRRLASNIEYYKTDLAAFATSSDNLARQLDFGFKVESTNLAIESKSVDREIANTERETAALFKLMDWRLNSAKYGTDAATQLAVTAAQQITGLTSLLKSS